MVIRFSGFTKGDFLSCNGTKVGAERLAKRMRQLAEVLTPQVSRLDESLVPVISPVYTDRNYRPNRNRPRDHACLIFVDRTLKRSPFPRLPQLGIYLHGDSLSIGLSAGWWPPGRLRLLLRSSRRQLRLLSHYRLFRDDVVVRSPNGSPPWNAGLLDRIGRTFFVGRVFSPEDDEIASPEILNSILLTFKNLLPAYHLLVKHRTTWNRLLTPLVQGLLEEERPETSDRGEAYLLLDLWKYLGNRAFRIDLPMLLNVYLAIKVKPFVLLSGISGTGKSLLVRLLAEGINGVRDGSPQGYRLIPVRPDWQDRRDLLGFANLLTGRYEMGDLLRAIREAETQPERPYFVCLDEMNLARVEHYFSDILSVMETGRRLPDGRWSTDPITLSSGSDPLIPSDDGSDPTPPRQPIPDNLVFFGTINVDESTYPFSRKVLDRANTIEFSAVDFRLLDDIWSGPPLNLDDLQRLGEFFCHRPYRKLPDVREGHPSVRWNEALIEINAILEPEDLHFGYRVRDEILIYMAYAIDLIESIPPENRALDEPTAFDFQVLQKILPRLSGPGEILRDVLIPLAEYCSGRYPMSERKLRTMLKRIEKTGFSHFWVG